MTPDQKALAFKVIDELVRRDQVAAKSASDAFLINPQELTKTALDQAARKYLDSRGIQRQIAGWEPRDVSTLQSTYAKARQALETVNPSKKYAALESISEAVAQFLYPEGGHDGPENCP